MILLKWAHNCRRLMWKIVKPVSKGSRALLIKENRILLVKHTYETQWYIPGGKVNKYECFDEAIVRELKEELGVTLEDLNHFGTYNNFYENKDDTVVIFISKQFSVKGNKNMEIEAYQFFDLDDLPKDVSPGSRRRIEEYKRGKEGCYGKW